MKQQPFHRSRGNTIRTLHSDIVGTFRWLLEYSVNLLLHFETQTHSCDPFTVDKIASDSECEGRNIWPNKKRGTNHDFSKSKTHKNQQQLFINGSIDLFMPIEDVMVAQNIVTLRWELWLLCCAITSNSSQCLAASWRRLLSLSNIHNECQVRESE